MNGVYIPPRKSPVMLVLGNGFDISCGLKSKYKNFFDDYVIPKVLNNPNNKRKLYDKELIIEYRVWDDLINSSNISVWEYYLASRLPTEEDYKEVDWFDIESLIADSFREGGCWYILKNNFFLGFEDYSIDAFGDSREEYLKEAMHNTIYARYKNELFDKNGDLDINSYYKVLLKELNILEAHFGEYIKEQIADNKDYISKKNKKLDLIKSKINENLEKVYKKTIDLKLQIISFNYTKTPSDEIMYIHGTYENPIIGINNLEEIDEKLYVFNKVRRRGQVKEIDDFWKYFKENNYDLVFYGTSFGPCDYSEYKFFKNRCTSENNKMLILYSNFDGDKLAETKDSSAPAIKEMFNLNSLEEAFSMSSGGPIIFDQLD